MQLLEFDNIKGLSKRERQILGLAATGLSDREISEQLHIGSETIKTFWISLRRKLSAKTRTHAVAIAGAQVLEEHLGNGKFKDAELLDGAVAYFIARMDGNVLRGSYHFFEELRYEAHDVKKINLLRLTPPEFAESDNFAIQQLEQTGIAAPYYKELFRRDLTRLAVIVTARKTDERNREVLGFFMPLPENLRSAVNSIETYPQQAVVRRN